MTEEKGCKNCDALGVDSEIGVYYCCLSHRQDDLPKEFICDDYTPNKQFKRLEQLKNKYYQQTLDDEITISDLITKCNDLEQENKELKNKNICRETCEYFKRICNENTLLIKYRSALEEIKEKVNQSYQMADRHIVLNIINEVLG